MRVRRKALLSVAVVVVVSGCAWIVVRKSVPHAVEREARARQPGAADTAGADVGADGFDPRELALRVKQSAEARAVSLDRAIPSPQNFASAVEECVAAYVMRSPEKFNAYCSSQEIEPLASPSDPAYASWMWEQFASWFGTAIIDAEGIEVRWRYRNGIDAGQADTAFVRTTSRDQARRFWTDQPDSERQSIEVVLPLVSEDLDHRVFESRLGIEFGYDAAALRWVVLRTHHYDVPNGVRIVEAPV